MFLQAAISPDSLELPKIHFKLITVTGTFIGNKMTREFFEAVIVCNLAWLQVALSTAIT